MTDKNTAVPSNGNGFLWSFLLVVALSTAGGLIFWKWMKGSNHPRPKGEPMAELEIPTESDDSAQKPGYKPEGAGYGPVAPFSLTNHDGTAVTLESLKGKTWIADFVFTRCSATCPPMSAEMSRLRADLKDSANIYFVSFSVDPANDTPEVLTQYAANYGGADSRWYFLTGDRKVIYNVALNSFKVGMDLQNPNDPTSVLHSTRFFLVDGAGTIRGRYASEELEQMKQLRKNAREIAEKK